jgi:hypothetical protein
MSSQGPSSGPDTGYTGITGIAGELKACILVGDPSQVPPGYAFNKLSIRDASDWIKYKKQARINYDSKISKARDPWFVHGNDFRLESLNGNNKCVPCRANAISGSIF